MSRIHTLSDIGEGNKLGDLPSNRYPPSRTELENLLNQANHDYEIAIECGNRLANKCSVLDKDNKRIQQDLNRSNKDKEKVSKHIYQLIDEVKRLYSELDTLISQITHKDISLNEYKDKIHTKLKEIKTLQSKIKASKTRLSSTQKDSSMKESEIYYLRVELSALNSNLVLKNSELEHMKNMLTLKNDKLELIKNDLAKKNSEIHSLETRLKELLPCNRLSSEQVKIGGKTDEKNDDNISVTQSLPNLYLLQNILYVSLRQRIVK
ncbi:14181_t:CDS:1 [Cetraspora pellucida]|uniref:14181_t:CDS:1 n=1 Tax=Cetraspora pellucida TaxID=1433469 RepID=A0ACA9N5G3_9GLOM|nr:14181_t:CDS:1 [Cetraspora pellucida]